MGKVISIHSFRGGTGKSNLTANLASQFALAGNRVGVVDSDIQSPGIHVLFGLDESKMGHTLNEFLRDECNIEDVAFNVGSNTFDAPGRNRLSGKDLWLIPSSIKGSEISKIVRDSYDPNKLNEGLQHVQKALNLDFLFIDTHPGLNEETLLSITISDVLVIILRPDQQDFQGTAVTVDIARLLDVPDLHLVVNKALAKYDFGQMAEEISGVFDSPVAGVLPLSEDLVDNASVDIFSLMQPEHTWSQGVQKISQALLGSE